MNGDIVGILLGVLTGFMCGISMMFIIMKQRVVSLQNEIKKNGMIESKFQDSFRNLANEILEEKQKTLRETSKESINQILKPLEINIKEFKERVDISYKDNIERSSKIVEKISSLEKLNNEMTKEASKLTRALKGDNKTQGDWGEMILESLLEKSGLTENDEYYKQGKQLDTINEEGINMKPDYVVRLPEDRYVIIDSKVSLTAYERFINAVTDEESEDAIKALTTSIKQHITSLGNKRYQDLNMNTPKFVMLFVPIEAAYGAVLSYDKTIFDYATSKNIIVVTPTTLLSSLWLVNYIWKGEKQTKNAMEMARQTGMLYDKLVTFLENFEQVGSILDKAQGTYAKAFNSLKIGRGNVIQRAESIKNLGITNMKSIRPELLKDSATYYVDENVNEDVNKDENIIDAEESFDMETDNDDMQINA